MKNCNHPSHVHTIQCIITPSMCDAIKMRGTKKQRRMVQALEKEAESFRVQRQDAAPATAFLAAPTVSNLKKCKVRREIYDGQNRAALPGKLARKEGSRRGRDKTVNEAYDGSGHVHKMYCREYRRNSLDGNGMKLISTVHHRKNYNNAFWNGEQMAYGDGDGIIFKKFTELSIIGHELSHGVVQFSGGLIYRDQSGALNESFADVFGSLTKQYQLHQTAASADWLVGEDTFGPNINGSALRSLKTPGLAYDDATIGKDPQPYHMDDFVITSSDNGGVHINSGIPNHAFFLLSQYLGGFAWEKAGHIWYDALQAINNPSATFSDWAIETMKAAAKRFGSGSIEEKMTRRAWKLVGI